jgi:hypothetical protein
MVGFDGSEMDDQGDGDELEEMSRIELLALLIEQWAIKQGYVPVLLEGATPGETILGISTGDGLDMSVSISYTA